MGNCCRKKSTDLRIFVVTGDKRYAGMDANLKMVLHDNHGAKSHAFKLDNWFRNDFERGASDEFRVNLPGGLSFENVEKIEFWRDNVGIGASWFVERIAIEDRRTNSTFIFPVYRWIKAHYHYIIQHLDTHLPQLDDHREQREMELAEKRKHYQLAPKAEGMPAQVKQMPEDEKFSWDYKWNILKTKAELIIASKIVQLTSGDWESLTSLKNVYTKQHLIEPIGARRWTNDVFFGHQRVASCSHAEIKLCTHIPEKLGVTEEMLAPMLEGMTIQEALEGKKMFIIDLEILKDLPCCPNLVVCCPVALFLENSQKQLVPIAIQLFQEKGPNNPVFLPRDNPWTWLLAKMWFNNADASVHQSLTHLAFTHLMMEGISVITHRNLSQSHPIFKLLAPHFLYLIAINTRGLEVLISAGGWVDKTMNIGIQGMFELIRRGITAWRMDVEGTIPVHLEQRGMLGENVLAYFPYRDDALLLYGAIKTYVTNMVNLYYDTTDKLEGDTEIQSWASEMVKAREEGGVGLKGVPGDGHFSRNDQLILVLTCIISTCSVGHASTNFPQYDEYAFPPNYPGLMRGKPPTNKDAKTEQDVINAIPDKLTTLDTMVVTKILSGRGTKSLGDFEVNYIFDPAARKIVQAFREEIKQISQTVKTRNQTREPEYHWLDPDHVPNSISI